MGEKKVYIRRDRFRKRSIWDSRIGMVPVFLIGLVLFAGCLVEIVGAARNLARHAPEKFGPGEIIVSQEITYRSGRAKETLTMATLRGKPVAIVGGISENGWLLPETFPDRYRDRIPEAERSGMPVLEYFEMHPFVSYAFGFFFTGAFLVISGWICVHCVRRWIILFSR